MLLYAQRAGALVPLLELLERYEANLLSVELEWLDKAWPRAARNHFRHTHAKVHEPDQAVLTEWYRVAATVPPPTALKLDGPKTAHEYQELAIKRARRRLASG